MDPTWSNHSLVEAGAPSQFVCQRFKLGWHRTLRHVHGRSFNHTWAMDMTHKADWNFKSDKTMPNKVKFQPSWIWSSYHRTSPPTAQTAQIFRGRSSGRDAVEMVMGQSSGILAMGWCLFYLFLFYDFVSQICGTRHPQTQVWAWNILAAQRLSWRITKLTWVCDKEETETALKQPANTRKWIETVLLCRVQLCAKCWYIDCFWNDIKPLLKSSWNALSIKCTWTTSLWCPS